MYCPLLTVTLLSSLFCCRATPYRYEDLRYWMRGVFLNDTTTAAGETALKWVKQNKGRPTPLKSKRASPKKEGDSNDAGRRRRVSGAGAATGGGGGAKKSTSSSSSSSSSPSRSSAAAANKQGGKEGGKEPHITSSVDMITVQVGDLVSVKWSNRRFYNATVRLSVPFWLPTVVSSKLHSNISLSVRCAHERVEF